MYTKMPDRIITTLPELSAFLPETAKGLSDELLKQFPMAIPEYYLNLIDFSDPNDPIFKMSVPSLQELQTDGVFDTSGEGKNTKIKGLQHKYRETSLILSTNQCAMYCRYCFRKRLVGLNTQEMVHDIDAVVSYIQTHTEINNVLVSGGDSLLNSNHTLGIYLEKLSCIDHLDYIRFGSKVPIVLPDRILKDDELQALFRSYCEKKQIYVVTQFNHPNELTEQSIAAVKCLQRLGVIVKNQTVLMQDVNDSADCIAALFNLLVRNGIVPYYLFQCRPVSGVKNHFQVPIMKGISIVQDVKQRTSGNGKDFRYVLSNEHGKLEIVGIQQPGKVLLQYHQAKDISSCGALFERDIDEQTYWISE